MNKLYGLYRVDSEESEMRFITASLDYNKLIEITYVEDHTWMVCTRSDTKMIRHTTEGKYPKYMIYEIPFVC